MSNLVIPFTPEAIAGAKFIAKNVIPTSRSRLCVAFWVIGQELDDQFFGKQVADGTGELATRVSKDLKFFREAGMVSRITDLAPDAPMGMHVRTDVPSWGVYIAARQLVDSLQPPTN